MFRKRRRGGGGSKPSLLEVWERLAADTRGRVEVGVRGKPERLELPHGPWSVVVDIHTVSTGETTAKFTRIRGLFVRDGPFTLKVKRRHFLHALAPLVGLRPVHIGYGPADRELFVRSDRPEVARSALRGTALGQALLRTKGLGLQVVPPERRIRKAAGDAVGEVRLLQKGVVRDLPRLRALVQIVTVTLDEMARLGVAREEHVADVTL